MLSIMPRTEISEGIATTTTKLHTIGAASMIFQGHYKNVFLISFRTRKQSSKPYMYVYIYIYISPNPLPFLFYIHTYPPPLLPFPHPRIHLKTCIRVLLLESMDELVLLFENFAALYIVLQGLDPRVCFGCASTSSSKSGVQLPGERNKFKKLRKEGRGRIVRQKLEGGFRSRSLHVFYVKEKRFKKEGR
jgi:hypothetical protein